MNIIFRKIPIEKVLITLIMITYFIPNFYEIDRIGNQWLFLSLISLLSFIYIIFNRNRFKSVRYLFLKKEIIFYSFFILWVMVSIFFSLNKIEALVTFNQYFTVFFCFLMMRILSFNIKNSDKYFLNLLLVLMIIETLLVISPILNDISDKSLEFRSMRYIGAAANVNITAFSLIYKVPVLFYFLENSKKLLNKLLISSLLFLVIFIVSILGTRGAFIGVGICVLVFVFYVIVSNANFINKIKKTAWIFLPLILAVLVNIKLSSESDNNVISRASTINISTNDGSVNQRLRFYNDAFNQFIKKPIFGVGIGNWKLESIDYDKNNINGFIVPYHAHNDFLQILAESGILGLISYLLFLFYSTKVLFKKSLFDNHLNIFLLGSFAIFILDSLLNFPIARPISQLFLIALFTLISSYDRKSTE